MKKTLFLIMALCGSLVYGQQSGVKGLSDINYGNPRISTTLGTNIPTPGSVLQSDGTMNYWGSPSSGMASNGIPSGGDINNILIKTNIGDYQVGWFTNNFLTNGSTANQIVNDSIIDGATVRDALNNITNMWESRRINLYVDPNIGIDAPDRGNMALPFRSINYAFSTIPNVTKDPTGYTNYSVEKIVFHLAPGNYYEGGTEENPSNVVIGLKRARVKMTGTGVRILGEVQCHQKTEYIPATNQAVWNRSYLPWPWTGGFVSPTFEITGDGAGVEGSFSADSMIIKGKISVVFEDVTAANNWSKLYGHYFMLKNIAAQGGAVIRQDCGQGIMGAIEIDSCQIENGNLGCEGKNRTYGSDGGFLAITLKAHNSMLKSVIGPMVKIAEIDNCRIQGGLSRNIVMVESDTNSLLSNYHYITGHTATNMRNGTTGPLNTTFYSVLADGSGTNYQINIFKDATRTNLVATSAYYNVVGDKTIYQAISNNLGGSITVSALGTDTNIWTQWAGCGYIVFDGGVSYAGLSDCAVQATLFEMGNGLTLGNTIPADANTAAQLKTKTIRLGGTGVLTYTLQDKANSVGYTDTITAFGLSGSNLQVQAAIEALNVRVTNSTASLQTNLNLVAARTNLSQYNNDVGFLTNAPSGTTNHNELNNLDYINAGHTGFQPVIPTYTNQVLPDTGTIYCIANWINISGTGVVTMVNTNQITPGQENQTIIIYGTDSTNTVTITSQGNVKLSYDVSFTMGQYDSINLVYKNNVWVETSRNYIE